MSQFVMLGTVLSAFGLPLLALVALLNSKIAVGPSVRNAQRRFLALLVVMTFVTAHTVTTNEPTWLIHTVTLSLMVVGSLWIPDQPQPMTGQTAASP